MRRTAIGRVWQLVVACVAPRPAGGRPTDRFLSAMRSRLAGISLLAEVRRLAGPPPRTNRAARQHWRERWNARRGALPLARESGSAAPRQVDRHRRRKDAWEAGLAVRAWLAAAVRRKQRSPRRPRQLPLLVPISHLNRAAGCARPRDAAVASWVRSEGSRSSRARVAGAFGRNVPPRAVSVRRSCVRRRI